MYGNVDVKLIISLVFDRFFYRKISAGPQAQNTVCRRMICCGNPKEGEAIGQQQRV